MLVKDVMSSSIISVKQDDTFDHISYIMRSEDIGAVPVCDNQNRLIGIITDRDLIMRYLVGNTAQELMTESPISIKADDDIHNAAIVFSNHRVRRLPVLDGGRLVGMLSLKDMAKKKVLIAEIGHILYNICN